MTLSLVRGALTGRLSWARWLSDVRSSYWMSVDWEMVTYWALVGTSHALHYHFALRQREIAAAQLEARLAEARLQGLQRQLHPHFLFNTLHGISALMQRDLAAADLDRLRGAFGRESEKLIRRARGIDERPVEPDHGPPKSISQEWTFTRDVADAGVLRERLRELL